VKNTGFSRRCNARPIGVKFVRCYLAPGHSGHHAGSDGTGEPYSFVEAEERGGLRRTRLVSRPRKPKPGDEPERLAFARRMPCVVGPRFGRCRRRIDPHHMTGGKGEQRRGKSQTVSDRNTLPLCRRHHDDFHAGRGVFLGWSDDERRVFQEDEIDRLNKVYEEWRATGVFAEPVRETA